MLLDAMLQRFVKVGELTIIDPNGQERSWRGPEAGPATRIRFKDSRLQRDLLRNAELGICEAYMDDRIEIIGGTLYDFFEFCIVNADIQWEAQRGSLLEKMRLGMRKIRAVQPGGPRAEECRASLRSDRRVLPALPRRGHAIFLRLFRPPTWRWRRAQLAKKRHIAAKLR